ncbi:MAG: penicillin-binding protein activator LpoB [Candidatus Endonucleobacter sp. (ex Gigantidas childressi)]|nr:penicillin-binding protein activator LpoB [Candidatus Endonucleobacter sp. (ex Gigantidas childressi)]
MKYLLIGLMASTLWLTGCVSSVGYHDASAVETTTADFGSTDLQMTAEKMVDSMLTFPPIVQVTFKRHPVMFVDSIKNKSMEHIDTESITDTISTKLLRSGKFRFVDMTKVEEVRKQLDYQANSGMVSENASMQMGRQIGAEYMLYGNLSSIVKHSGSTKDVYYKFTMKLMHIESGTLEWQDEKEIRKVKKKSLFGM